MKKKYLYGIVGGIIAILLAVFLFLLLGMKCSFSVSAGQGYTVTVKGIELGKKDATEIRKGEKVVFAVVLDRDYSDSNLKVMANDTELTGKDGVYRYTVENDTKITIEGVTENDYIVQGVDMNQETLEEEGFLLLRDENKRPIPVLSDIAMSSVDRTDIPNLNLTASVLESVNPGWKFRELTAVNLGKYSAAKFYVKHSSYLEAKFSFGEKFYERGGSDVWHEFLFQNDEGMMTLYVDGEKIGSCNYLSDILFCLQDKGSYKFSHIYVIPKDGYQGAMLSVGEGEGYQIDIPAREYAIGATLQFHVNIDEGFMKGSNFAVKAGNQVLEERTDGSYTFVFNGNTTISVTGVVAKPLDSRYQVVGTPMRAEWEETANYILVQSVANTKTYTHTQAQWGSVGFEELELKQYSNLLFFMKKDDTDPKKWVEILQKADDGTVTPYLQKNDNIWHKVEIKKEGGQMYFYLDGERNSTPIIDTEHLSFVMNEGLELRITSLLGITDPNYVPPEPDYISSAYKVIGTPMAIEGEEVENYILVSQAEDAKTYEHTPPGWRGFNMVEMDFAPYKSLLFFVHKEDENTKTYLEVLKGDPNQIPHEADYVSTNNNKWYKIELVKNDAGKLDVYVNDEKHNVTIANTKDLMVTISAKATLTYTSLFGIADPAYVPPEPDYIDEEYVTITSSLSTNGEEIENYELVGKTEDAKTYQITPPGWRGLSMTEVDIAPYESLIFFVHKEDVNSKTYLEVLKGDPNHIPHEADYVSTNDNKWYKVELVKNEAGELDVYVNDVKHDVAISSVKDLTITISANATLMYTSVFGKPDPAYVAPEPDYISSEYKTIDSAFELAGEETTNYELVSKTEDAKTYQFVAPGWRGFGLTELETARYQSLLLFVHKDDVSTSTWLELYKGVVNGEHLADYISTRDNQWYKVELVKTETGEWDVYINDVKQDTAIASVTDLTFTISGGATLMYTSVFGIADPNYTEPEPEVKDIMVVTSPWAYYRASMDNNNTYTEAGYEYATKIQGYYQAYDFPARMKDVDLSLYSEFRFAVKSSGGSYNKYEVKMAGDNTTFENDALFTGANETSWTEYVFKCEDDGTGTEKFHMYKAGEATDVWLPSDMNLSDLQMRASYDTSAVLYMTELRGVVKEGAESALKVVATSFNNYAGDTVDSEKPNQFATASTKVTTSWSATKTPLADIALAEYSKIIFYARQYEGSGYFESDYFGTEQMRDTWIEFRLVKNSEQKWDLYRAGRLITENIALSNLNEVHAAYGNGNYYFSQVFGVEADTVQDDDSKPTLSGEYMVVTSPWAYNKGTIDNSQTYTEGGYEYATLVPGGHVYYEKIRMKDVDLSIFREFKFAMKTNGSYWYEAGLATDNDYSMIAGANTSWREFVFKYEDDGTGNKAFHMYKDGGATSTWLPADLNLSELQMRFSTNESAVLYMTELRGTVKEGVKAPLQVAADSFNTKTGTEVTAEKPNMFATKSTEAVTSQSYTQDALTSVDLSSYNKILFYARKAGSDEKNGWFESVQLGSFVTGYNWTEFKLVKNADGTWNIWTGGVLKASNQTLTNLSDITATYGINHYYFSEVFGVGAENVEDPEDEGPILSGEYMVVTSPWAYNKGTIDNSQTYTEGGYEYATLVPGGHVYYEKIRMKDVDLSIFREFKFAMKTNGSYWYEAGLATDNDYSMIAGANTSWREFVFKYEDDGTGNKAFHMYKDGGATSTWLPADLNLSELQMRFSTNESAVLYMTELRGTVKEGVKAPLQVVADSFNTKTGTEVTNEKPNMFATKSTEAVTSHSYTQDTLTSVDLSSYNKILFYARKAGSDEKNGWFESVQLGSFVMGYNWTEFKLVKNADGTWNVWTGGVLKQSNQILENLSDITATYGINHYYFSEVFGMTVDE